MSGPGVLVQPEMERWRSPLASIPPFSRPRWEDTARCGGWWNISLTHLERTLCMCEDRRNGAGLDGRFGSPGGGVKMFDKNLVHAIISGKDLDCGSAELSVNLVLTHGHGSLLNPNGGAHYLPHGTGLLVSYFP